jgi:hypothetical protein
VPDLNKLPVPHYAGNQPYHWEYDNVPLDQLALRDQIISNEVDVQGRVLQDAIGTQGTLANRLNQSINPDGTLKESAVDQTMHNVAEHTDGSRTVDQSELAYYTSTLGYASVSNPVPFVRMLQHERDKLALIADEATNMPIQVETPSNIVLFEQGPVHFAPSDSIQWQVVAPNQVKAVLGVSIEFAHIHYYDIEPITSDYLNFKVTTTNTPYIDGSLRVYVNGVRLSSEVAVYAPSNPIGTWTLRQFTPSPMTGTFTLNTPLAPTDLILIDFDVALT